MNKINQNKITFILILSAIAIIFSSLTILSLPVLFNYESKVGIIEKNFYKSFKIYLNSSGKISYKPFPKPHLLVENASINLLNNQNRDNLTNTSNLKIFISLRDIYLRSYDNFSSVEISNSNIDLKIDDIIEIRKHLYQKINKPIVLKNCKIFVRNSKNEAFLISPVKRIIYKINNKNRIKDFIVDGEIFGLKFKSKWRRSYKNPKYSLNDITIFNPNIEIKNSFYSDNTKKFTNKTNIIYEQDRLEYKFQFDRDKIIISSPTNKKINFNFNSKIQLKPFFFNGTLIIKEKKIENIIDNFLSKLILYDENYLGNLSGSLKINFNELNNKLIKKGELEFIINEKKINISQAKFNLHKIGKIISNISFKEDKGNIIFVSKNKLFVEDHIEFAKIFQVSSKKVKSIKQINFTLEKNINDTEFIIKKVKINNKDNNKSSEKIFLVKNIQNLRSHIRNVID